VVDVRKYDSILLRDSLIGSLQGCPGGKPWAFIWDNVQVQANIKEHVVDGRTITFGAAVRNVGIALYQLSKSDGGKGLREMKDLKKIYARWGKTGYKPELIGLCFQGCDRVLTPQERDMIAPYGLLPPQSK